MKPNGRHTKLAHVTALKNFQEYKIGHNATCLPLLASASLESFSLAHNDSTYLRISVRYQQERFSLTKPVIQSPRTPLLTLRTPLSTSNHPVYHPMALRNNFQAEMSRVLTDLNAAHTALAAAQARIPPYAEQVRRVNDPSFSSSSAAALAEIRRDIQQAFDGATRKKDDCLRDIAVMEGRLRGIRRQIKAAEYDTAVEAGPWC